MERFRQLLDELEARGELPREGWLYLLAHSEKPFRELAAEKARALKVPLSEWKNLQAGAHQRVCAG